MLEIKFQLWDEIRKQMWTWEQLIALESNTGRKQFLYQAIVGPPKKRILRIYTGLKDRNGMEIYEGDIVPLVGLPITPEEIKAVVVYDTTKGRFLLSPVNCYLQNAGSGSWTGFDLQQAKFGKGVIGNIYENPDLLQVGGK
ncbi:YopX family protein [Brevibacillus laterosporus]|uniref:YopX family protein n=1 Tax=Brevibacillus laterosporus TaxID=1465 RepID=UPI0018CF0F36|nr:YopX family protein [Brevibacillus laterosporus]MBG9786574.1 hypothetical protein [Brevibacillus laterosporus]